MKNVLELIFISKQLIFLSVNAKLLLFYSKTCCNFASYQYVLFYY